MKKMLWSFLFIIAANLANAADPIGESRSIKSDRYKEKYAQLLKLQTVPLSNLSIPHGSKVAIHDGIGNAISEAQGTLMKSATGLNAQFLNIFIDPKKSDLFEKLVNPHQLQMIALTQNEYGNGNKNAYDSTKLSLWKDAKFPNAHIAFVNDYTSPTKGTMKITVYSFFNGLLDSIDNIDNMDISSDQIEIFSSRLTKLEQGLDSAITWAQNDLQQYKEKVKKGLSDCLERLNDSLPNPNYVKDLTAILGAAN